MADLWNQFLYHPLVNIIIGLYNLFGHNLGWAIIALTSFLRFILIPLSAPSLKTAKKIQELSPELEKLKAKYTNDKQGLAQAQLELYKKHGANPASGCLPQIVQIIILIALFNAFNQVLHSNGDAAQKLNQILYPSLKLSENSVIDTKFFFLDLSKPDVMHLPGLPFPLPGFIVIISALTQFISSKMMLPQAQTNQKIAEKTPQKDDDLAVAMQTQMLYMFPIMTLLIGLNFPSGLALYWLIFSLFSILQQRLTTTTPTPQAALKAKT